MDATPTNGKKLPSLLRCKSNGDATTNANPPNGCKNVEFKKPTSNGYASASAWVCRNLACKNDVSLEESFCKRCSCCICHRFDDNKDPSLWLVCSSEVGGKEKDFCGASCHIECAIEQGRVGCVSVGDALNIDGSYCCAYCGKVSGILGFWRRQLEKAKEARRVDNLCQRIYIAFRLLNGTHQFKELHHIAADAYAKLETEVGPLDGVSAKMARSIVSRLPVSRDVQRLCSLGVEKVDQLLHSSEQHPKLRDSLPAACKFKFEHITSTSLVIILRETPSTLSEIVKGYKLWYWKSRDQNFARCPHILQKSERKILIDNLEPCTEYCFRIISFTEEGDMGHSETRCFTGSIEITIHPARPRSHAYRDSSNRSYRSTGFKIRNVGRVLRRSWAEEGVFQDFFPSKEEEIANKDSCGDEAEKPQANVASQRRRSVSRRLDLNTSAVPDLNVEAVAGAEDSGDSHTCRENEMEIEMEAETESGHGVKVRPTTGLLDEDYEYCVKVVRWLECLGCIDEGFRMRFLTWFSLGSSEQERKIVLTFISTLIDDPSSLACQLEDSFMEIVSCKKPCHKFCTKLWH
ncbi:VIN3-like protein 1 isoform X2 [Carex rostrata]